MCWTLFCLKIIYCMKVRLKNIHFIFCKTNKRDIINPCFFILPLKTQLSVTSFSCLICFSNHQDPLDSCRLREVQKGGTKREVKQNEHKQNFLPLVTHSLSLICHLKSTDFVWSLENMCTTKATKWDKKKIKSAQKAQSRWTSETKSLFWITPWCLNKLFASSDHMNHFALDFICRTLIFKRGFCCCLLHNTP